MEPCSEVGGRSEAAFPAFVAEAIATKEAAFPAFIAQAAAGSEATFTAVAAAAAKALHSHSVLWRDQGLGER
jgi:hypothetical protein